MTQFNAISIVIYVVLCVLVQTMFDVCLILDANTVGVNAGT